MNATIYNYSTGNSFERNFPVSDEELQNMMKAGEVMVDDCDEISIPGRVGMSLFEFNNFCRKIEDAEISNNELKILGSTYLINEIEENLDTGFVIVDFDAETEGWSSSNFYSEDDKGRVLYDLGLIGFPVPVPEGLEDYMDYAMAFRDAEINKDIRSVCVDDGCYMVIRNSRLND